MALRIITWPMGFIILARGEQVLLVAIDLAWALVHVGLAWPCIQWFGLEGAGVAFLCSYVFHGFLVYPVVRRLTGFRWSSHNVRTGTLFLALITLVFVGFYRLSPALATAVGLVAVAVSVTYSAWILVTLVPLGELPAPIRRLAQCVGWGGAGGAG
jgi:PST family polysaccharide transporter